MSLRVYVPASTANPLGRRPWGYKLSGYDPRASYLSAYYHANFAVPNPNEIGARIDNPGLGASFNKPGGITLARWASRDNPDAPRPVYGPPEVMPGHFYARGLGLVAPTYINGGPSRPVAIGPVYGGTYIAQSSPQPVQTPAAPVQTTMPQQNLTPATAAPSTPPMAISSSGQPMSTSTPANTTAAPAVAPGSIQDLYNQALAWLQSSSVIPSLPNFVPVGVVIAFFLMNSGGKGRR